MLKRSFLIFILIGSAVCASAQSRIIKDFEPVCKALDTLILEKTTVKGELELKSVMKRGNSLDFYFKDDLSDIPWTEENSRWFRAELKKRIPAAYRSYNIGRITSRGEKIEDLVTGTLGFNGRPNSKDYRQEAPNRTGRTFVEREGSLDFPEGLDGRHIALWQSHGLYFEQKTDRWEWQRACLFQTVEDMYTQTYVIPFLVPMLENAGAYVMLPRERDIQLNESIVDNDPDFRTLQGNDGCPEDSRLRTSGTYSETGNWKSAGEGFADTKAFYSGTDNPFTSGTARQAGCIARETSRTKASRIVWTPEIRERGRYAVYVSYKSLPNSTANAHYTVHHLGGRTGFIVNQKIGGGTWIYLGSFEFEKGKEGYVTLDNCNPEGCRFVDKTVVTGDAVKIGGGYGNIARSIEGDGNSELRVSGMPRFTEGARYWLQWAGIDPTIYTPNEMADDYKDDFMSRGDWVEYLSRGSAVNPAKKGKGIPFDLSFALHSDAGVTPNDSTVGTLAIYTLISDNKRKLPDGEDRSTSREFSNLVQSQIVNDIRTGFEPIWNRRFLWDRGYRESRTPTPPSMLCELLSHQNFADMKYGLNPAFRFAASRAIYKGMLKYLSNRYGTPYTVQPLPVNSFSARLDDRKVILSWRPTMDRIEPTAAPDGYILYTRINDGAFDQGRVIEPEKGKNGTLRYTISVGSGHICSFRIAAFNKGGRSFPSETLSAGIPVSRAGESLAEKTDSCVLVINNFDRVSSPAWFDYPEFAGFDNRLDSGVPYMKEIGFTGEMYEFRRNTGWKDDECQGFGASYNDKAGSIIAGNSFDFPYVHGKAIMKAGYPFCSASAAAFCSDTTLTRDMWTADIICGKQISTLEGKTEDGVKYSIFPEKMQESISRYTALGGNILISGSNISTDVWDEIYPIGIDSTTRAHNISFVENVLGYTHRTNQASRTAMVRGISVKDPVLDKLRGTTLQYNNQPDSRLYCVETPDGIVPSSDKGMTFLRYCDTWVSAGVCTDFGKYRVISIGFPLETVTNVKALENLMETSLQYFKSGQEK